MRIFAAVRMTGILVKKELFSLALLPIIYVVAAAFAIAPVLYFVAATGFFLVDGATVDLRIFFLAIPFVSILALPVLTMASWADEIHSGTLDFLSSLPVSEAQLVLAKFFASFIFFAVMTALTLPLPLCLSRLGDVDAPAVFCSYLGILLFGSSLVAVGNLLSLLSRNTIAAYITNATALLIVNCAHLPARLFALPALVARALGYLSFAAHFERFAEGVISASDTLFFVAITFYALYLSSRLLTLRKSRG